MATKIPDVLKSDLPPNKWGKVLGATPVIMTIIATLLAGLSNGEMTKAQYDRALAAQQQSKAGDQWAFFQAKRVRSAIQSGTLDVVQISDTAHRLNAEALNTFATTLNNPAPAQAALKLLLAARLPEQTAAAPLDPKLQEILDGIEISLPETELIARLNAVQPDVVAAALRTAHERVRSFDALLKPTVTGGDQLGEAIETSGDAALRRDFAELRLRYSALRYDAEAMLNRTTASLHEVQVRQSNLSAERHHRRSGRFFYGMLGAQAAVIISTFAMAARQRNLLWSLAAVAGLGALSFAAYVFLYL